MVGVRVTAAVVGAREERIDVRPEAEERDVSEIEQPGPPDDDVQPQREQRVDEDEDAVVVEVAVADRQERDDDRRRQQGQLARRRQDPPEVLDPTTHAGMALSAVV